MSDNDKNNSQDNEKFSFIKEEIIPKRKSRAKKIVYMILATFFLGIIFGVVGRITFSITGNFLDEYAKEEDEPIIFPTESPRRIESTEKPTEKPEHTNPPQTIKHEKLTLEDYEDMYHMISMVAEKVNPSIVTVTSVAHGIDGFNNQSEQKNLTSGIIVGKTRYNVYILVTDSRIDDSNNIRVTFMSGETFDAILQSSDKEVDLAVIKVSTKTFSEPLKDKIQEVVLGESYLVSPGDPVIALGNPNGYLYSVEVGMISNNMNSIYITDNRIDLFNTNMHDNPNGDGIIVDLNGRVKGIITNKFKSGLNENINTVMSISRLKPIIQRLVNNSDVTYMGIVGQEVTAEISQKLNVPSGIYVNKVETNSPAFDAGLQNGDIIVEINGESISSVINLNVMLMDHKAGDKISVKVQRNTNSKPREMTFAVELGKR